MVLKSLLLLRPITISNNLKPLILTSPVLYIGKFSRFLHSSINKTSSTVGIDRLGKSEGYGTELNVGFNAPKAQLVLKLNFESAEDAVPFYTLPVKTLVHIYKTNKNDEKNGFCRNRLYYLAHRIKCAPPELSECLAKRTFIYSLSFNWLENSLNVLLDMGVSGDRILRDLWVLKYHHETIRERLQRVKDMGIETFYPWMVRCSEGILNRFIAISQETKYILGESESTHIYLAKRLNTSPEAVQNMCFKIPALKTIRVAKIKSFLDFLIREGFEVQDIASKPRVFTASQKTVEQRLKNLRALGVRDINLNVLCKSKKDFKKYFETIEAIKDTDTADNT